MDFFAVLFFPLKWIIEFLIVSFHSLLTGIGFGFNDGWTWILSVLLLVVVIRSAMIPITIKQLRSMRGMMEMQPEIKKINEKYKGKRDKFSLQKKQQDIMSLYKKHGANPMSSCFPMLIQTLVFLSLFQVLHAANLNHPGVGILDQRFSASFSQSKIFGASLSGVVTNPQNINIVFVGIVVIVLMISTQFYTQFQISSQNVSLEAKESQFYRSQQIMLYLIPVITLFSGLFFPIGVMVYWAFSNIWTLFQQWVIIRNSPTPGSIAAKKREIRLIKKGKWDDHPDNPFNKMSANERERNQPISKQRKKKKNNKKNKNN